MEKEIKYNVETILRIAKRANGKFIVDTVERMPAKPLKDSNGYLLPTVIVKLQMKIPKQALEIPSILAVLDMNMSQLDACITVKDQLEILDKKIGT